MMRLKYVSLLFAITLVSCEQSRLIYYSYNGITITRLDEARRSYFYFGYCNNKKIKCATSYFFSDYQQRDGLMFGYLVFNANGTVVLVNGENLEKIGTNPSLIFFEFDNVIHSIKWDDSINGNYKNVLYVSDNIENEKAINKKHRSRVTAIYE